LVRDRYAPGRHPSVDPVVFVKRQLVLFFEGFRSERQLMLVVADQRSLRWYLSYDSAEPLPDDSRLTRVRDRCGLPVFRTFIERIVQHRLATGLVWSGSFALVPPRLQPMPPSIRSIRGSPSRRISPTSSVPGRTLPRF
jgi:hypothetical protein